MADQEKSTILDYESTRAQFPRFFNLEMLVLTIAALAALVLVWTFITPGVNMPVLFVSGLIFTISIVIVVRLVMDPDSVRARQSDAMLRLASLTLDQMQDGMTEKAAIAICRLLLPNTAAAAVAITNRECILGYAGYDEEDNRPGEPIRTQATNTTLQDGQMRVLHSWAEIGFPAGKDAINAAIIVPLIVSHNVEGTLKFYYRRGRLITATQKSIAEGFGRLLSTQMAATEVDTQRQLATSMELRLLQSQINPHFLFNTINTIASLIRTDPLKARTLLREFAVFYRRVLDDSADSIHLSRELEQTQRYFSFEEARFGEDRVALAIDVPDELQDVMVPPFILQPLVENAVHHGMPLQGKLNIVVSAEVDGPNMLIKVSDNGVGMEEEKRNNILHPESTTGMGIAMKNIHDRMKGVFGPHATLDVESAPGQGTTVTLCFPDCADKAGYASKEAQAETH